MEKNFKLSSTLAGFITILPAFVGMLLWKKLPDSVPIHFTEFNQPDGYASRGFAVFVCPLIMLVLFWLVMLSLRSEKMRQTYGFYMSTLLTWLVPVLSCVVCGTTYLLAFEINIPANLIICGFVGLIFVALGFCIPTIKRNTLVGLKFRWTLASDANWEFTHKVARFSFIFAGLVMICCGFYYKAWIAITGFAIGLAVPYIASWQFYKKYGNKDLKTINKKKQTAAKKADASKIKKLN